MCTEMMGGALRRAKDAIEVSVTIQKIAEKWNKRVNKYSTGIFGREQDI